MNKTLILVVEDDRPIRNLIVTTLKTHDYKYLAAENGSSAILEASSHHPDIVLLDLGLPDMEGVEVIKKIRTWSNMPIIVISARSEDTEDVYKRQDQVSGGLKRLDSSWKPEITEVCKLCGSTRNVRGGLCLACKNKC